MMKFASGRKLGKFGRVFRFDKIDHACSLVGGAPAGSLYAIWSSSEHDVWVVGDEILRVLGGTRVPWWEKNTVGEKRKKRGRSSQSHKLD